MWPRRRDLKFNDADSDQQVQHLLRIDHRFAEVRHEPDERRVPLVRDFCKCRRAGRHEDLPHAVLEGSERLLVDLRA